MEAALGKSGEVVKEEKRVESSGDEEGYKEEYFLKLESSKAEMGEVKEENQRLRMHLNQIMKDYQNLQMQFHDIVKHESKESTNRSHTQEATQEPDELISLSLGTRSSEPRKDQKNPMKVKEDPLENEGLALGLHSTSFGNSVKSNPEEDSLEVEKEAGEGSPPCKVLKTMRREDDEVSQQTPLKKARVSVRVRCDTPTMNDGCQWRKYGQKIAKGNPCPRAYYRCTLAPTCPVRKQVQRWAEDMSILTTTYEGSHNHPLPISATAMASTTSAAASMLLSGSSTSGTAPASSISTTMATSPDFHRLKFYLSDTPNSKHYYLPNSSISSAPSNPTITLDLTSTTSSSPYHFNNLSSAPRYSSTNLNFSSLESNPLPTSWSNTGVLNYRAQAPYNKDQQTLPTDTIAAATKAITSDPSFQSALATALNSIIGTRCSGGGGENLGFQIGGESSGKSLDFCESFPLASNFPSTTANGDKCFSNYLTTPPPSGTNSLPANMRFFQPLPPPSANKFST